MICIRRKVVFYVEIIIGQEVNQVFSTIQKEENDDQLKLSLPLQYFDKDLFASNQTYASHWLKKVQ